MAEDDSEQQDRVLDEGFETSEAGPEVDTRRQRRSLAAFFLTVGVVVGVLAMLPIAIASMAGEMRGQATDHVYDLFTGAEVDAGEAVAADAAFVNITVTSLEEARRIATLTISGHRVCTTICPPITATFYALGNDAAQRRGLPPSASITVPEDPGS